MKVTFPFAPIVASPPPTDLMRIEGNSLTYLRPMATISHDTLGWYGFDSDGAGIHDGGILVGVKPRSSQDARYIVQQWKASGGQHVHA